MGENPRLNKIKPEEIGKSMDELKALFGDGTIDYATFESKLTESGISLANLASGQYVAKGKFDKLQNDFAKYKAENDVSKYADYDQVVAERDSLKAEKEEAALATQVAAAGVNEKFRKFVLAEVKANVTKDRDFKTCLENYIKDNPQFTEQEKNGGFFSKGSSTVDLKGNETAEKNTNKKMNEILRGVRK